MRPVLELDDVTVRHDGRTVLRIEHLVADERRIGVVGANGSGKSTLLRLLDGLVAPDTGRVRVAGLDPVRDGREVRRRVGFCFQDPADQIVMPVVADDIAFGLKNRGVPTAERDRRVAAVLARFGIEHLAGRAAATLSGGEKQMVALAAVLVVEPATVLFDEPTGTLDLARSLRFAQVLAGLDVQAVVATHDLDLLAGSTGHPVDRFDRVLVLDDGQIVADDAPGPALVAYRELAARTCAAQTPPLTSDRPPVEGRSSGRGTKQQVRPSSRASSLDVSPEPGEPCALGTEAR
ncbi:MAG: energy-coupling factor ABC transporter ATP-binding protein [Micrococcales bacterium]|nr:energy-coupling factor ABC transporter ATP-binding protein [Micrococcales bacterium]